MSEPSATYDPEVRRILEGIQRARGTPLLRIPKGNLGAMLRTSRLEPAEWRRDPVALEAELVGAYREQVAYVLYEASKLAMYRPPVEEFRVCRTPTVPGPALMQRAGRLERRVRSRLDADSNEQLARVMSRELDALSLALASCKVVPSEKARLGVAVALIGKGRDREAFELLQERSGQPFSDEECAARAVFNLGFLEYRAGNLSAAREHYRSAAEYGGSLGREAATGWLTSSALIADSAGVLEASRLLGDWSDEPGMKSCLRMLRAARTEMGSLGRRQAVETLRPLADRLSETGTRVADVLCED